MPKFIATDFEDAAILAIEEEGGTSAACLYHFAQILWRHAQAAGIQKKYCDENNLELRKDFHRLIGLSFLPATEIPRVFDQLVDQVDEQLEPLLQHLHENYIHGHQIGKKKRGPHYPPKALELL